MGLPHLAGAPARAGRGHGPGLHLYFVVGARLQARPVVRLGRSSARRATLTRLYRRRGQRFQIRSTPGNIEVLTRGRHIFPAQPAAAASDRAGLRRKRRTQYTDVQQFMQTPPPTGPVCGGFGTANALLPSWAPSTERTITMQVQCCVCKKVRAGSQWVTPAAGSLKREPVSHGYCPACAAKAFAELDAASRKCAARAFS